MLMYIYSHICELPNQITIFADYDNFLLDDHLQNVFMWLWQNYPRDCDKMDDSDIVLGQNEIAVAHIVRSILTSDCSRLLWKRAEVPLLKFAHQF